jgi:hypothetical protein
MLDIIKRLDFISPDPSARLHFGHKLDVKTKIGGCISLCAISLFLVLAGI